MWAFLVRVSMTFIASENLGTDCSFRCNATNMTLLSFVHNTFILGHSSGTERAYLLHPHRSCMGIKCFSKRMVRMHDMSRDECIVIT